MSATVNGSPNVGHAEEQAIQVLREEMNRLRGRMFGAIDSWGVPERQANGAKGLVRHLTYDAQRDMEAILRGKDTT